MTTISLRRSLATACLAVATLPLTVACGNSDPAPVKTALDLAVSAGETPGATTSKFTLTCDPVGGTHTDATAACAALLAAGGDPSNLVGDPTTMCAQVYDPVTATVTGTWQGRTINWQKKFGNTCELRARTTPLF